MKSLIRIGTRGSKLALYQANLMQSLLTDKFPDLKVEIEVIKTTGDIASERDEHSSETKRIYTREIEDALLKETVDIAVHSAKDMAVPLPQGLKIGAVPPREDPRDCLIGPKDKSLKDYEQGSIVGTSSLRRKIQALRINSDIEVKDLHGNVDTRIRKVQEGQYQGIILAMAGVKRIELADHVSEVLDPSIFLPAPGQGIIVAQSRENDSEVNELLEQLNHADTLAELLCERAFLKRLEGGCQLPCGIHSKIDGDMIEIKGALFALDGDYVCDEMSGRVAEAAAVGETLAESLLSEGGKEILEKVRAGS